MADWPEFIFCAMSHQVEIGKLVQLTDLRIIGNPVASLTPVCETTTFKGCRSEDSPAIVRHYRSLMIEDRSSSHLTQVNVLSDPSIWDQSTTELSTWQVPPSIFAKNYLQVLRLSHNSISVLPTQMH
eukprot:3013739-Rhodomonas_salina.1